MSSHFSAKSLTFYAVAIGSVLVLFNVVTAYGESKLKAPNSISGRYRLVFTNSLSNCAKPEPVILQVDQSGVYANAAILPSNANPQTSMSAEERLTLTGSFHNGRLNLSGWVPRSILCSSAPEAGAKLVAIASTIEKENMSGEIAIDSQKTQFTAQKEADTPNKQSSSH